MVEELLKKIPAEKCWAITAKALTRLFELRVILTRSLMGEGEGIFAPVMAWEKHEEISDKVYGEHGMRFYPWLKETFNIPVEDAIGAAKLRIVAATLQHGPELTTEIVEATPERTVTRTTACPYWERIKEYEVNPKLMTCHVAHQALVEAGLKRVNPKITFKLTKAISRGDPYCEGVYELKET